MLCNTIHRYNIYNIFFNTISVQLLDDLEMEYFQPGPAAPVVLQPRDLMSIEQMLSPYDPCCEGAISCVRVKVNAKVLHDRDPIIINGKQLEFSKKMMTGTGLNLIYTNKDGCVATITYTKSRSINALITSGDYRYR